MGTNYYLKGHCHNDNPIYHVGKWSRAGLYCYDCKLSLCKGGESQIHNSTSEDDWYKQCPNCKKKPQKELNNPDEIRGVWYCGSFRFAMPANLIALYLNITVNNYNKTSAEELEKLRLKLGYPKPMFEDDTQQVLTREQMVKIVNDCTIKYYDSMGNVFC